MAIPKLSSKEMMDTFFAAKEKLETMELKIDSIGNSIAEKSFLIDNEIEYINYRISNLEHKVSEPYKIIFAHDLNIKTGVFNNFGSVVHQKFVTTPIDLFNIRTSDYVLFRGGVSVLVNDQEDERAQSILMHSSVPEKKLFFREYSNNNLKLTITANNGIYTDLNEFNVIELNSYLPGSFDIVKVEVYSNKDLPEPDFILDKTIKNAGYERIILPSKQNFAKVNIHIKLNYQNASGKYPFGLENLVFYNANFFTDSYLITSLSSDKFIKAVYEDIIIQDIYGERKTTLTNEGIELYAEYINNMLSAPIAPSTEYIENTIAKNIKEIFIKIPLKTEPLISLRFEKMNTR